VFDSGDLLTNAEGVREFQPRVASTLGKANIERLTLKALAKLDAISSRQRFQRFEDKFY